VETFNNGRLELRCGCMAGCTGQSQWAWARAVVAEGWTPALSVTKAPLKAD